MAMYNVRNTLCQNGVLAVVEAVGEAVEMGHIYIIIGKVSGLLFGGRLQRKM